MVKYPDLNLPGPWRLIFRELEGRGWTLDAVLGENDWAFRPTMVYVDGLGQRRFLTFLNEALWCGNTRQAAGMTILAISHDIPNCREEAEAYSMPMTGDWESQIGEFFTESL